MTSSSRPRARDPSAQAPARTVALVTTPADPQSAPLSKSHARPARALIGWLAPQIAQGMIAGPTAQPPFAPGIVTRTARAIAAVAARTPHAKVGDVISDPSPELGAYIAELQAQPFYAPFKAEGWQVRIADLRYVRALQPVVHADHGAGSQRVVRPDDPVALARITLPQSISKELLATVPTADGRGWILTCRSPQLRIRGPNSADRHDNGLRTKVFGIETEMTNSLVQVVRWRGVYVLRDGYHRAYGLLSRGVTRIPVLYNELPDHQPPLLAAGLFDPSVYGGDRAPLLPDYLDDAVSAAIEVRRTQKTFVIQVQVTELDTPIL